MLCPAGSSLSALHSTAFLGYEPTGERVSFPEHVFYRFDNRQIVEVWSVIDKAAIGEQLSKEPC